MNKRKSKAKFMKLDVRMPRELLKQVWAAAEERKCSASDVVLAALAAHLNIPRLNMHPAQEEFMRSTEEPAVPRGGVPPRETFPIAALISKTIPRTPPHETCANDEQPTQVFNAAECAAHAEFPDLVAYYEQNGGEAWAAMTWEQRYAALKDMPR